MKEGAAGMEETPVNILIPTVDGPPSTGVIELAQSLLRQRGGEGTVLSVVEVPPERSLSEGAMVVRRRRSRLRKLSALTEGRELRTEVRTAHSVEQGVRDAAGEMASSLMVVNWRPARGRSARGTLERLVADPPCDLVFVKSGPESEIRSVMVPARGGPQARLALRVAECLARQRGAVLSLVHIVSPRWDDYQRSMEERFFHAVRDGVTYDNIEEIEIEAESIVDALLHEGSRHDVVVMGATARDERSSYLLGPIPEAAVRSLDCTVVVVKTREPVTAGTFGIERAVVPEAHRTISDLVDRWFAENTFHSHEFRHLRYLLDLKERQGVTISVALPTLNEEKTVGKILETIREALMEKIPLVDELLVIDSDSTDDTVRIVESMGIPLYRHPTILPAYGSFVGKGEALWKSLAVTRGDIVVWVDSDITGFHPKFVYGLIGPLLTQPEVGFVKGFYRRPLKLGGQLLTTGGGRVTELTARPLLNLFYPHLSGLVQPLAGEMAGRRKVLQSIPFFTGYGVETGLLIDILDRYGLRSIAQSDLEYRVHRNQSLLSLSKMAFAITEVVMRRLEDQNRIEILEELSTSMKLIHYSPTELFLEVKEIQEQERPPMESIPEYGAQLHGVSGVLTV